MNSAKRLIDAMSRRDFLKRIGIGAAVSTATPSLMGGHTPKYWQVNKSGHFLMSPESLSTAKPYFGQALGHVTKSGLVVNGPEKVFIPNELYQKMVQWNANYLQSMKMFSLSPEQRVAFLDASRKLSNLETEVSIGLRSILNPNFAEKSEREAKKKEAEKEARKKSEAQKAREHRSSMHRWHQKQQARRSRMDYAGGSEDVHGVDYTTLENLNVKQMIDHVITASPVVGS